MLGNTHPHSKAGQIDKEAKVAWSVAFYCVAIVVVHTLHRFVIDEELLKVVGRESDEAAALEFPRVVVSAAFNHQKFGNLDWPIDGFTDCIDHSCTEQLVRTDGVAVVENTEGFENILSDVIVPSGVDGDDIQAVIWMALEHIAQDERESW